MPSPTVPRLKKMVEYILDENPRFNSVEARNSDIALTIIIWQRWYNVSTLEAGTMHLKRLFDLPREDNIKRIRAIFNAKGEFLPTSWKVAKQRGIEREDWEKGLGYKLEPEERTRYHDNVKETAMPDFGQGTLVDVPPTKPRRNFA